MSCGTFSSRMRRPAKSVVSAALFQVTENDREFVAAEPRDRVGVPDQPPQLTGDGHQQLVADGMAERVVDRLETVEVEA